MEENEEKWTTKEIFCRQNIIPANRKYICSNIYKDVDDSQNAIVVGSVAVSDYLEDHCILQFFEDDNVTDFFISEIVLPTEKGNLTESWLIERSIWKKKEDLFFFSLPMATSAYNAKTLCEVLYTIWDEEDYLFDATREIEILDI
jgi:hypothetical protein